MMKNRFFTIIAIAGCFLLNVNAQKYVGTWATAEQLVESNNLPPSPGLSGNSLRQIVRTSIGGEKIKLKLSNEFSNGTTEIKAVEIAIATTSGSSSNIETGTSVPVTFDGKPNITMKAGEMVTSDEVSFHLVPAANVAITLHYGSCSNSNITGHPGSRTTSYLVKGNTTDFSGATKTEHWYNICGIDVEANDSDAAIAVLGNSITDGRGSTTNGQNRWCDVLAGRLLARSNTTTQRSVLNMGIGGNCVLGGGLGPCAAQRYARDLFGHEGVKYIILFEAVNDLGSSSNGVKTANSIIDLFKQIIRQAHKRGILVYGATITPFKNNSYFSTDHEKGRQTLNEWIRKAEFLDGVIDFDKMVRDPADTLALQSKYLYQNDWLHLNADGYQAMGSGIDLTLFDKEYEGGSEEDAPAIWVEAERMTEGGYGSNFKKVSDLTASNGYYMLTNKNTTTLTTTDSNILRISFDVPKEDTYYFYARLKCPSYDDDSYFISIDNGNYSRANGLATNEWDWKELISFIDDGSSISRTLSAGTHTFTIAGREDGAQFDKLCITTDSYPPIGMGEDDPVVVGIKSVNAPQSMDNGSQIYNIKGQRLDAPQKGVNIIDGKKKIMK